MWDASTIRTFGCIARGAIEFACQAPEVQAFTPSLKRLHYNITEPDAAASFFLQSNINLFEEGDTFLLLDLGGGISDPCMLRVAKSPTQWACWPLRPIQGLPGGPTTLTDSSSLM